VSSSSYQYKTVAFRAKPVASWVCPQLQKQLITVWCHIRAISRFPLELQKACGHTQSCDERPKEGKWIWRRRKMNWERRHRSNQNYWFTAAKKFADFYNIPLHRYRNRYDTKRNFCLI
jgi:hypothetical protein